MFIFLTILRGLTVSCGCYNKEALSINKKTHGLRKHPIYNVWTGMKQRCFNGETEAYKNYGGRGITVCDEWVNSFQTFYDWAITNGWEKGLEIDREDNDGNYEPNNCHFIMPQENVWNRRLLNGLNKSGYCGINFNDEKWVCRVAYKNERIYLGRYKTAQTAAFIRDKYCVENDIPLPLNFTWLNPNIGNPSGWAY